METKTIAVDFSSVDIYPKIEAGLAGLEIGVLGKFEADAEAISLKYCFPFLDACKVKGHLIF